MATPKGDPALFLRLLSEHDRQPTIQPYQWIVHTAVDGKGPTDLGDYFEHGTNLESHTWLRWTRHERLMDFDRQADANYKANRFLVGGVWRGAVSTETEDDGSPEQLPWNDYQIHELIRFGTWLSRTYGIPPEPPKVWNGPGMGYHSLFPMIWTNVRGKTCPGRTRITQFLNIVLPGIRRALANNDIGDDKLEADERAALIGLKEQFLSPDRLPLLADVFNAAPMVREMRADFDKFAGSTSAYIASINTALASIVKDPEIVAELKANTAKISKK